MPRDDDPSRPSDDDTDADEAPPSSGDPLTKPEGRATALSTEVSGAAAEDRDDAQSFAGRYDLRAKIGEGGMGEVHLCGDRRIGREVAMKVIRAARGSRRDLRRRFLREARVQGQLEHPSIVPVYDLGRDPSGAAYFTMKRVRGMTLEDVLGALRAGDENVTQQYTRHKLLTAFGNACLAVHFAHTRGVLHRDLKPDNIMLGDFGEVYVLDWGLAKVMDERAAPMSDRGRAVTPDLAEAAGARAETAAGAVMGTPGYMAPEQIHGAIDGLDARTDVYALGTILFEILTLAPLHGKGSSNERMTSTLVGAEARPSVRAPERDVAPELEAVCVRATALDPKLRFPSARELYTAVEAFLSGDRDVERRRELAREHARHASEATDRALVGGDGSADDRTRAMREVSRAIALDSSNAEAMATLVRLFTSVPRELPREAKKELAAAHGHSQRVGARTAVLGYLSWLAYAPVVFWMGLKNGAWGVLCDALFLAAAGASFVSARARTPTKGSSDAVIVLSTLALVCSAGMFGPFILLPAFAGVNAIVFVVSADRSRRVPSIVLGCVAMLAAFCLEWVGVLPPSFAFKDGALTILPRIVEFPEGATLAVLLFSNVAVIVTASVIVARFRDALVETEQRLYFHTWQLRQFVPGEAYGAIAPPSAQSTAQLPAL